MPFYTRPLLTKNQSALALGICQRADTPPAQYPDILIFKKAGPEGTNQDLVTQEQLSLLFEK